MIGSKTRDSIDYRKIDTRYSIDIMFRHVRRIYTIVFPSNLEKQDWVTRIIKIQELGNLSFNRINS